MTQQRGYLNVTLGPMFSEKSTKLISILNTHGLVKKCLYVNHANDTRSSESFSTHNNLITPEMLKKLNADMIKVEKLGSLSDEYLKQYNVACIDEASFFEDLVPAVKHMVDNLHLHVFVVGLNSDFNRQPFGHVIELAAICDEISLSKNGICGACARKGVTRRSLFTHLIKPELSLNESRIIIGGKESYEALCRECYLEVNQ